MSDNDLRNQLEGLFSGDVPDPQGQPVEKPALPTAEQVAAPTLPAVEPPAMPTSDMDMGRRYIFERTGESPAQPRVAPRREMLSSDMEREDEPGQKQQRDHILNVLLIGAAWGGAVAVLALIVGVVQKPARLVAYVPFFAGYALILAAALMRRLPRWLRMSVLFAVAYGVALFSVLQNGMMSTAPWYLFVVSLMFFALSSTRAGGISAIVHILLYLGGLVAFQLGWLTVLSPIAVEKNVSQAMVVGGSFVLITVVLTSVQALFATAQRRVMHSLRERSESLRLAQDLAQQRALELEQANQSLQRQTAFFALSAQVGYLSTQSMVSDEFIRQAINLVHQRLDLYDVSLFLLEQGGEWATLEAQAGRDDVLANSILERPSRIAVTPDSLPGECVALRQARVISTAQDLSQESFALPEARSAMVLPMVAQGQVIGLMIIQSKQVAAFQESDVVPLLAMTDQLSNEIYNTRLYAQLNERLEQVQAAQRYYVREAWDQFLPSRSLTWYEYEQPGVTPLGGRELPEVERVLAEPRLAVLGDGEASEPSALVSPISLRDQVIGVLGLHQTDQARFWSEEEIGLVSTISEQMGLILENARLFEEARVRAGQERQVRKVSTRMRESLDVDMVLRTAVDEMYRALGLEEIVIRLATEDTVPPTAQ